MKKLFNLSVIFQKILGTINLVFFKNFDSKDTQKTYIDSQSESLSCLIIDTKKGAPMVQASMLTEILQKFVSSTPDIQGAALVTPDGLSLTSVLPSNMDEERTAAMSAAMLSLGERISLELVRGLVDRIVVEGEKGYSVMVACGSDAVLLVLAAKEAKQGILFLEIKRIVQELAPMMG